MSADRVKKKDDMKRTVVYLPEAIHHLLRVNAAEEGVSMGEFIRRVLAREFKVRYIEESISVKGGRPRGVVEIDVEAP